MSQDKDNNKKEEEEEVLDSYSGRSSREYKEFMREKARLGKVSFYEKLCNISESIISIEPDEEKRKDILDAIEFVHLNATPTGVYTFAILTGILIVFLSMGLFVLNLISVFFLIFGSLLGIISIALLINYPKSLKGIYKVKASDELVLAVIYIAIYMRSTPNLDGAIRFTAQHLKGPLANDFKKIMWDVETRKYSSVSEALDDYILKWKDSKAFVQSISIIKDSTKQVSVDRKKMLDKAVDTVMVGSKEEMQGYANSLQLPIMVIHALGIMLPVMVLVMFPIIVMIMEDQINPFSLVLIYNIILPSIIYVTGRRTLEYRPMGMSTPDISLHPKYGSLDSVYVLGKRFKIWPLCALISASLVAFGIYLLIIFSGVGVFEEMALSLVITWGLGLGPIIYFYLSSRNKLEIRDRIMNTEEEFSDAIFSLGNKLSMGKPIVKAIEDTARNNQELKVSGLFKKALDNVRRGGMTLSRAFFDRDYGAIWDYPSRLIISIIKITIESTKKGVQAASVSLLSISKYLKQIHSVEEDLKNMLSSQTTSMKFLGGFLGPLVAGVTVSMAGIMMYIFSRLGASFDEIQAGATSPGGMGTGMGAMGESVLGGWGGMAEVMPPAMFQIVVGIYMIQTTYLLAMLSSGVENGPNDIISKRYTAALLMFFGLLIYTLAEIATWQLFGEQLTALVL